MAETHDPRRKQHSRQSGVGTSRLRLSAGRLYPVDASWAHYLRPDCRLENYILAEKTSARPVWAPPEKPTPKLRTTGPGAGGPPLLRQPIQPGFWPGSVRIPPLIHIRWRPTTPKAVASSPPKERAGNLIDRPLCNPPSLPTKLLMWTDWTSPPRVSHDGV